MSCVREGVGPLCAYGETPSLLLTFALARARAALTLLAISIEEKQTSSTTTIVGRARPRASCVGLSKELDHRGSPVRCPQRALATPHKRAAARVLATRAALRSSNIPRPVRSGRLRWATSRAVNAARGVPASSSRQRARGLGPSSSRTACAKRAVCLMVLDSPAPCREKIDLMSEPRVGADQFVPADSSLGTRSTSELVSSLLCAAPRQMNTGIVRSSNGWPALYLRSCSADTSQRSISRLHGRS